MREGLLASKLSLLLGRRATTNGQEQDGGDGMRLEQRWLFMEGYKQGRVGRRGMDQ